MDGDRQRPFREDDSLDDDGGDGDSNGFQAIVNRYGRSIMMRTKWQKLADIVNVPLWDLVNVAYEAEVGEALKLAWRQSRNQIKINASLGCLLVHKTTGEYRYFHSSSNSATICYANATIR